MFEINALPQARKTAQDRAGAGDAEGARELLEQTVRSNRAALADGDPELLAAMRDLATLHSRAGDPASARRLLEEARAAGHRLAATDPLAVMLAYDLGAVAEELGNRHVARTSFAEVTTHGPAALGENHWVVEHARAYLTAATEPAGEPSLTPPPPDAPPAAAPMIPARPEKPAPQPPTRTTAGTAPRALGGSVSPERSPGTSSRKSWVIAAAGITVGSVIAATAILTRPGDPGTESAAPASSEAAARVEALVQTPATAVPPAAPSAAPTTATAPAATTATGAAPTARPQQTASMVTKPPAKTTGPAATTTRTRIVAPANGSKVPYPFDARFSVSAADVKAKGTVLAVLVCVNGRCYLDGKVDIVEGVAAPYTIYLGSTRPEGTGIAWQLRVDRLTASTYSALLAEREARWTDGSWGDKGTTLGRLNRAPVSAVSVVKTGA
ncbi:tetratricopeptide repeat protein [Actinoplanes sp. CA-054009]